MIIHAVGLIWTLFIVCLSVINARMPLSDALLVDIGIRKFHAR